MVRRIVAAGAIFAMAAATAGAQANEGPWVELNIPLGYGEVPITMTVTADDTIFVYTSIGSSLRILRLVQGATSPDVLATLLPASTAGGEFICAPGAKATSGLIYFSTLAGLRRCDIATGTVSTLPPPAAAVTYDWTSGMAATPASSLYVLFTSNVLGGIALRRYDEATGAWTGLGGPPSDFRHEGVRMAYSSAGGPAIFLIPRESYPGAELYRYDIASDAWATSTAIEGSLVAPPGVLGYSLGSGPDGNLYAVTGTLGSSSLVQFNRYDPRTNAWQGLEVPPVAPTGYNAFLSGARTGKRIVTIAQRRFWSYATAPGRPEGEADEIPGSAPALPESGGTGCHASGASIAGIVAALVALALRGR